MKRWRPVRIPIAVALVINLTAPPVWAIGRPEAEKPAVAPPAGNAAPAPAARPLPPDEPAKGGTRADNYGPDHAKRVADLRDVARGLQALCAAPDQESPLETAQGTADALGTKSPPAEAKQLKSLTARTGLRKDLCRRLCRDKPEVPLCAFSDDVLASVAVEVDAGSLKPLLAYVARTAGKLFFNAAALADFRDRKLLQRAPEAALVMVPPQWQSGAGELAGLSSQMVSMVLTGLARLIRDRAKQESIGWVLDRLGRDLCGDAEIKTYWFPKVCALAAGDRLWQYGAGTTLLRAFQGAVIADVRGWPGAMSGVAVGNLFSEEVTASCGASKSCKDKVGELIPQIRQKTAENVTRLLAGESAPVVLADLGTEIDRINHRPVGEAPSLYGPTTQTLACGLALPKVIATYQQSFGSSIADPLRRGEALLYTAFNSTPGCWTIFGQGIDVSTCDLFSEGGKQDKCTPVVAATNPGVRLERLTTIYRLRNALGDQARAVAGQMTVFRGALDTYQVAADEASAALVGLKDLKPPAFDPGSDSDPAAIAEATRAYVAEIARALGLAAYSRQINAALGLAAASIGVATAATDALAAVSAKDLYPGLCAGSTCPEAPKWLRSTRSVLAKVDRDIALIRTITEGDWSTLTTAALGTTQQVSSGLTSATASASAAASAGQAGAAKNGGGASDTSSTLAKNTAVILAILQAPDGEAMAQALDSVASPPGGWRLKRHAPTSVFSVVAYPGLFGAAEWRWGPYGAIQEGGSVYAQYPTLTFPMGVEVAWATKCLFVPGGIFASLIDPAAFLNYDASNGSRLPGPSLKTVLALGFGLRFPLGDSPVVAMPLVLFRPGFRQWETDYSGQGADVLQIGLAISVDVTLLHNGGSQ